MTIEELKAGQPSIRANQQVIRRSDSDLSSNGGCDFKIMDPGELVAKRILKREAYAVDQGDSFFPNCARQELGPWYNLVTHRGKYLVFSAKATAEAVMAPGILGGGIGGAIAAATARPDRYQFILSLKTGNSRILTKEYLIARFKDRGTLDLMEKFKAEPDQDREFIFLRYVHLLNARLADDHRATK